MRPERENPTATTNLLKPERGLDFYNLHEIDKPQHECGVFGIFAPGEDVSLLTLRGIYRLQHRGQESAGIATLSDNGINVIRKMGLVKELVEDSKNLYGFAAIGHTRYSNTGGSHIANAQPAIYKGVAISENGNLTNSEDLRSELESKGIFPSVTNNGIQCSSDGELIAQMIATADGSTPLEKIINACLKFEGAYTLTILAGDKLFAVRDQKGFWPLCLGKLNHSDGYVIASESTALELVGASYEREIQPGEILAIGNNGAEESCGLPSNGNTAECPFDWNYFRRPDSLITADTYAYQFRMMLGRQLAKEKPVKADVVIAEKDAGTFAAQGFSQESGIPFSEGSIKDPFSQRIFIDPDEEARNESVEFKHSILGPEVSGKIVVVVTDSIVRGTQSSGFTRKVKEKGAREVHYRSTFPQIIDPCYFGIDTYSKEELIGADQTPEEVAGEIKADSVGYLSVEGFELTIKEIAKGRDLSQFCKGCYLGEYPIPVETNTRDKLALERAVVSS